MYDYIISLYLTKVQVFTHTHKSGVGCTLPKMCRDRFNLLPIGASEFRIHSLHQVLWVGKMWLEM